MPRRHFRDDSVGDGADQIGRDLDRIGLCQEGLNLADGQPAGVERDDLVVKAGEARLVFANQLRLERPLAIARDLIATGPSSVRTVFPLVP